MSGEWLSGVAAEGGQLFRLGRDDEQCRMRGWWIDCTMRLSSEISERNCCISGFGV